MKKTLLLSLFATLSVASFSSVAKDGVNEFNAKQKNQIVVIQPEANQFWRGKKIKPQPGATSFWRGKNIKP